MANKLYAIFILSLLLLVSAVMASEFSDYNNLRDQYHDYMDNYIDYRHDYLQAQEESDSYSQMRAENRLGDLRNDFDDLKDDAEDLLDSVDHNDSLYDDVRDLRSDAVDAIRRIDTLLEDNSRQYYQNYQTAQVVAAPEPKVKVEPLNVIIMPAKQEVTPVQVKESNSLPDLSVVWLIAGIIVALAVILFLIGIILKRR
ncbi:MAG: hypothetical protein WCV90_03555 [Candidatus Woesearchaeota archaeon]